MTALLLQFWPYILTGLAALAGIWKAYSMGKATAEAKQARDRLDSIKDKQEKDDEVDGLGHADLDTHFKRWLRDGNG